MYFSELLRKINWWITCLLFFPVSVIILNSKIISLSTKTRITDQVLLLPKYPDVLIPGAGTTTDPSSRNYSFASRMDKAAELFRSQRSNRFIVSGVSNKQYYNEPNDMKNELIRLGIPGNQIYPDHGGLRTFLSVKRARDHSGVKRVIIISQRNQLERALYIAGFLRMEAWGLEASPHPASEDYSGIIRELLARVKCTIECILTT